MTVFNNLLVKFLRINNQLLQVSVSGLQHTTELNYLSRIWF